MSPQAESTGTTPTNPQRAGTTMLSFEEPIRAPYMGGPRAASTAGDLADQQGVDMRDDNAHACEASQSCTDAGCPDHRFDLFGALTQVADDWWDSLPTETRSNRADLDAAFRAVANLAAAEVFG